VFTWQIYATETSTKSQLMAALVGKKELEKVPEEVLTAIAPFGVKSE